MGDIPSDGRLYLCLYMLYPVILLSLVKSGMSWLSATERQFIKILGARGTLLLILKDIICHTFLRSFSLYTNSVI